MENRESEKSDQMQEFMDEIEEVFHVEKKGRHYRIYKKINREVMMFINNYYTIYP